MKEQQKESSPDPGTPPEGTEMEPKTLHIFGFQFKLAIAITHLCITLYAMCFFIQIGALPVSYQIALSPFRTTLYSGPCILRPPIQPTEYVLRLKVVIKMRDV